MVKANARVLVIDDDRHMCDAIRHLLEHDGYAVDTATGGLAALERLAGGPSVDAAIVDLKLPDISGLTVLEAIKTSSPETEVIFLTGYASLTTAIPALNGEAFAYLTKPFEIDLLMGTLQKALEKRRLTQALRESEERYRLVAEHIMDAVLFCDLDGRVIFGNPRATELTGYPESELRGVSVLALLPAGSTLMVQESLGKAGARLQETEVTRRDGSRLWVEATLTSVKKGSEAIGRLVVLRDVTERKRDHDALRDHEAQLSEANERLQAIIDASPAAVIALDFDGRVRLWNPAAERMFGWRTDEALGHEMPHVPEEGREAVRAILDEVRRGERLPGHELQCRRRDGSAITVHASVAPVRDAAGTIITVISVLVDLSERRQLEAQLRQSQKMEGIGRLAGGVAHDFNNLLTVIAGRSQLLLFRTKPEEAARPDLELIYRTTERAAALTRQLLAFSRRQVLEPRLMDLNRTVHGMEPLLRRLIGEHIDLVVTAEPVGVVKADPSQLEQVILNLAVNARDAMVRGGRLRLSTRNVALDEEFAAFRTEVRPGPYVMLEVTDTGVGMDAETKTHVFEPFFTTKPLGEGTGLGLATVYGIVKQSGGHVEVYSERGQGTSVSIYLPRVDGVAEVDQAVAMYQPLPRGSETVLVVEDEPALRHLAREILELLGYTVLDAGDPLEALRTAEGHPERIDLLLTDVVMPHMNGRELAERLASLRPSLCVLYMSGYAADVIAQAGELAPGTHFLAKPFTPEALGRRVRESLGPAR